MDNTIRFYFDEHLPNAVVAGLRANGVDVLTITEAGRISLPDDEQLRFATKDNRVMVTHDVDFLVLASQFLGSGEAFSGVAFCPGQKYQSNVGGLIRALLTLHGVMTSPEMLNHVEYL